MQPDCTWIPAALEFAIALRALKENFDPYRYLDSVSTRMSETFAAELEGERARLTQEAERQALTRAVIDAWEKELIRQRVSIVSAVEELGTTVPAAVLSGLQKQSAATFRRVTLWGLGWLMSLLPAVGLYASGRCIWRGCLLDRCRAARCLWNSCRVAQTTERAPRRGIVDTCTQRVKVASVNLRAVAQPKLGSRRLARFVRISTSRKPARDRSHPPPAAAAGSFAVRARIRVSRTSFGTARI